MSEKISFRNASERLYGDGLTSNQIIDLFDSGLSLVEIYKTKGVSPQTTSKIVKASGRIIDRDIPLSETIAQLENCGITRDTIFCMYVKDNCYFSDLRNLFSEALGRNISDKTTTGVLRKMCISKSDDQIKKLQGSRSRAELAENLAKLNKSGFSNTSELAKYYEENTSLTREGLVRKLNSALSKTDKPFSMRWLDRHMDPHLSAGRLRGTSRVEKEFLGIIEKLTTSELVIGSYAIISPYQLDAYFPDLSLAIEFNGDYWHSDKFLLKNHKVTSLDYHRMKLKRCEDIGIKLFFVWESDWCKSQDLVIEAIKETFKNPSLNPEILQKLTIT